MPRPATRIRRLLAAALAAGSLATAAPAAAPLLAPSPGDRAAAVSRIWMEATYNFAFFDQVPDLDWDAAYREALDAALAAPDAESYWAGLERFVARLGDGHTNVWAPSSVTDGRATPAVSVRWIESSVVVTATHSDDAGRLLPVGSIVTHVDGRAVEEILIEDVEPRLAASTAESRREWAVSGRPGIGVGVLYGPAGSTATISATAPDGRSIRASLPRSQPTTAPSLENCTTHVRPDGIAVVTINTFARNDVPQLFAAALDQLMSAPAIVIDLRNNGGGDSMIAAGVAQFLTSDVVTAAASRTREHLATGRARGMLRPNGADAKYVTGTAWREYRPTRFTPPAGPKITAPIAVLTGPNTASAAEDLLVALESIDRVVRVGRPTAGTTGQPLMIPLDGGGTARVCTKRDTFPDGREFVGIGLFPHVAAAPTIAGLRAGRDEVLEAAIAALNRG